MIAVKVLEKRTAELKQKEAQLTVLESKVEELKAKHAYFEMSWPAGGVGVAPESLYPDSGREALGLDNLQ
jgi:hypothetical protein